MTVTLLFELNVKGETLEICMLEISTTSVTVMLSVSTLRYKEMYMKNIISAEPTEGLFDSALVELRRAFSRHVIS